MAAVNLARPQGSASPSAFSSGSPSRTNHSGEYSNSNNSSIKSGKRKRGLQAEMIPPSAKAHQQRHAEADAKASVAHEYRQNLSDKRDADNDAKTQERHHRSQTRMENHSKRRHELSALVCQLGMERENRADMAQRRAAANRNFMTANSNMNRSEDRETKAERARAVRERLEQHGQHVQAMLMELESGGANRAAEADREKLRSQNASLPEKNNLNHKKIEQQRLWALLVAQDAASRDSSPPNSPTKNGKGESPAKLPPPPRVASRDHRLIRGTTPKSGAQNHILPKKEQHRLTLVQRAKTLPPLPTLMPSEEDEETVKRRHERQQRGLGQTNRNSSRDEIVTESQDVEGAQKSATPTIVSPTDAVPTTTTENEESMQSATTDADGALDPDLPTGGHQPKHRPSTGEEHQQQHGGGGEGFPSVEATTPQQQPTQQQSPEGTLQQRRTQSRLSGGRQSSPQRGMTSHERKRKQEERAMIKRVVAIAEQRTMGGSASKMLRSVQARQSGGRNLAASQSMALDEDGSDAPSPLLQQQRKKSKLVGRSRAGLAPPLSHLLDKEDELLETTRKAGGSSGRYLDGFKSRWTSATICAQHWFETYGVNISTPPPQQSRYRRPEHFDGGHSGEGGTSTTEENLPLDPRAGDYSQPLPRDEEEDLSDGALGIDADDGASTNSSSGNNTTHKNSAQEQQLAEEEKKQTIGDPEEEEDDFQRPSTVAAQQQGEQPRLGTSHGQRSNMSSRTGGSRGGHHAMIEEAGGGDEFDIPPGQQFDDIGGSTSDSDEDLSSHDDTPDGIAGDAFDDDDAADDDDHHGLEHGEGDHDGGAGSPEEANPTAVELSHQQSTDDGGGEQGPDQEPNSDENANAHPMTTTSQHNATPDDGGDHPGGVTESSQTQEVENHQNHDDDEAGGGEDVGAGADPQHLHPEEEEATTIKEESKEEVAPPGGGEETLLSPTRVTAQRVVFEVLGGGFTPSSSTQAQSPLLPTTSSAEEHQQEETTWLLELKPSVVLRIIRIQRYWRSFGRFQAIIRRKWKETREERIPLSVPPQLLAQVFRMQTKANREANYPLSVAPSLAEKIAMIQRAGMHQVHVQELLNTTATTASQSNSKTTTTPGRPNPPTPNTYYRNSNRPKLMEGSDVVVSVRVLKLIIRLQRYWRSCAGKINRALKVHHSRVVDPTSPKDQQDDKKQQSEEKEEDDVAKNLQDVQVSEQKDQHQGDGETVVKDDAATTDDHALDHAPSKTPEKAAKEATPNNPDEQEENEGETGKDAVATNEVSSPLQEQEGREGAPAADVEALQKVEEEGKDDGEYSDDNDSGEDYADDLTDDEDAAEGAEMEESKQQQKSSSGKPSKPKDEEEEKQETPSPAVADEEGTDDDDYEDDVDYEDDAEEEDEMKEEQQAPATKKSPQSAAGDDDDVDDVDDGSDYEEDAFD